MLNDVMLVAPNVWCCERAKGSAVILAAVAVLYFVITVPVKYIFS